MSNLIKQSIKCGLSFNNLSRINNLRYLSSGNSLIKTKKLNDLKSYHIEKFESIIGKNGVKTSDLEGFNSDWLKIHKGNSELCLLPSTTEQLSSTLKYCNDNNLSVVIQGGNTGLVAGAVPANDEIIISLNKLNKIISFDEISGILVCESGCILQDLDDFVNEKNYIMPLDLGAKGSCHIGGNLATNAGGLRVIKYGNLHGSILGLEAVLMNGQIVDMMSKMRKDNTGYDLKQIFIGSEGTLGVITKASILCPIKPSSKLVGVLAIDTFDQLLQVYKLSRFGLNEYLSAFEMFDNEVKEVMENNLKMKSPFNSRLYALIEMSGTNLNEMENQFCKLMDKLMNDNLIQNGTYSNDLTTMNKLWSMRERIAEGLLMNGYCFKYDVSIPLNDYYQLVEVMRNRLKDNKKVTSVSGYGHIGDCNLHFTVTCDKYEEDVKNQIEPFIYEWVSEKKGSVSAEHGLGLKKNNHIHYSKSEEAIELMKAIKMQFDPKLLLNPQKMFTFNK